MKIEGAIVGTLVLLGLQLSFAAGEKGKPLPTSLGGYRLGSVNHSEDCEREPETGPFEKVECSQTEASKKVWEIDAHYRQETCRTLGLNRLVEARVKKYGTPLPPPQPGLKCDPTYEVVYKPHVDSGEMTYQCVVWEDEKTVMSVFFVLDKGPESTEPDVVDECGVILVNKALKAVFYKEVSQDAAKNERRSKKQAEKLLDNE